MFVVFDPTYGDRARDLLSVGSVWMVTSDTNAAVAQTVSAEAATINTITLFDMLPTHSIAVQLSSVLPMITKHHPNCGLALLAMLVSPQVRGKLERAGYTEFIARDLGGETMVVAAGRHEEE